MYRLLQNTSLPSPSKMTSPKARLLTAASSSPLGTAGSGWVARSVESIVWRSPATGLQRSCNEEPDIGVQTGKFIGGEAGKLQLLRRRDFGKLPGIR